MPYFTPYENRCRIYFTSQCVTTWTHTHTPKRERKALQHLGLASKHTNKHVNRFAISRTCRAFPRVVARPVSACCRSARAPSTTQAFYQQNIRTLKITLLICRRHTVHFPLRFQFHLSPNFLIISYSLVYHGRNGVH